MKKIVYLLISLGIIILGILYFNQPKLEINNYGVDYKKNSYIENKQSYEASDGIHTIYWMQGVKAPKMTNDPNLLGKEGYFSKEEYDDYVTYTSPFKPHNGYYDYNKNLEKRGFEHPLCYLASSSNLISWWLEQNRNYVNQYLDRLKNSDIYGSIDGLYKVYPYNQNTWDEILAQPGIEVVNNYKSQQMGISPLVTKHLNPYYYKKDDGYYPDLVLDFFFNGYDAIPQLESPNANSEDNFVKDPRGGYFHPLLGKTRIVQKLNGGDYTKFSYVENNLRRMFASGKGVSFSYVVNSKISHAITVWGAEYDSNGHLIRVFITDSDDYQPYDANDEYWRGLVGVNTVSDKNGRLALSNKKNINPDKPGNYVITLTTLSLAQDLLEQRLNDTSNPSKPIILEEPDDKILAVNANVDFIVKAKSDDGYLEYEWYESNTKDGKGKLISNKNVLTLTSKNIGTKYYYCIVKNIKNGKYTSNETKHFKVETKNIDLVNAMIPKVSFNYNTVKFNQFDRKYIKVDASVTDGGTLSYQWYQSNDNSSNNGIKLEGETNNIFYPPTNNLTNGLYYYCVVTNTNNNVTGNSVSTYKTPFSKRIIVIKNEIVNPLDPNITLNLNNYNIILNEKLEIKTNATSLDNGLIKYQWYEIINNELKILENETSNIFIPDTSKVGTKRYKCKITNVKNNLEKSLFTNETIITINDIDNKLDNLELLNATLFPKFDKNIFNYKATLKHNIDKLELKYNSKSNVEVINPKINVGETKDVIIKVVSNNKTNIYKISVTRDNTHEFSKWEVIKEPTCLDKGQEKRICNICGHTEYRDINPLGHDFETGWTFDKQPTNTEPGIKSHHCKRCGERKDITKVDPIKEPTHTHEFSKWEVIKEPTCLDKGQSKRTCNICGQSEYKDIDALGHDFSNEWTIDKQPTNTEPGIKSHHCKRCGERKDITEIEPIKEHSHEYGEWEVIKEPTKKENGIEQRKCNICGNIEEREIPKLENKINLFIPISLVSLIFALLIILKKKDIF